MTRRNTNAASPILSRPLIAVLLLQCIVLFSCNHPHHHHMVAGAFTIKSTPQFSPFTTTTTAAALSPYSKTTTIESCARRPYSTRCQLILRSSNTNHNQNDDNDGTRRKFITTSILSILSTTIPPAANAAIPTSYDSNEDLTSQLYNEDGSPKGTTDELEAKSRTVSIAFPTVTTIKTALTSVDGIPVAMESSLSSPPPPAAAASTTATSPTDELSSSSTATTATTATTTTTAINVTYQVPDKWTPAPEYLDTLLSVQKKACDRIVVYQVPDRFEDYKTLEKATVVGVTKALAVRTIVEKGVLPENLTGADLIGGRKVTKAEGRKYYEFDLAVAPAQCSKDGAENLGLGFCPYDTIVLFSATIIEGKMMVCALTCTRDEWKRSSADIKRVRESFFVETSASV